MELCRFTEHELFLQWKTDSLKEFIQGVITNFLKTYSKTPDFERTVWKFSTLTKESLLFSCDIDHVHKTGKLSLLLNMRTEDQYLKDMAFDLERAKEMDRDLDHSNL